MKSLLIRLFKPSRLPRHARCDLSPHLRRDMGLPPCPKRPHLKIHTLW